MTSIPTGGGNGHAPGCTCPFCTSTSTTAEATGVDLNPAQSGNEATDGPELLCAMCCGEVHDFEPDMGDGYSWETTACPRCGIERAVFNLTEF
jgi:hypothetical protein